MSTVAYLGNKKDNLTIIYTPADNLKVNWWLLMLIGASAELIYTCRKRVIWRSDKCRFTVTNGYVIMPITSKSRTFTVSSIGEER
jgi:hypothetical protein